MRRRGLAAFVSLMIVVGCGSFGSSSSPEDAGSTSGDAAVNGDANGFDATPPDATPPDATPPDAKTDAPPSGCTTTIFGDDFENRADLQGGWTNTKISPSASLGLTLGAIGNNGSLKSLSVEIPASNSATRVGYLEKKINPAACHELELSIYINGYPTPQSHIAATMELEGINTGAILVELVSPMTIQVVEQNGASSKLLASAPLATQTWKRIKVRIADAQVTTDIAETPGSATRTVTTAQVAVVRVGAPLARMPACTYLIDDVIVR